MRHSSRFRRVELSGAEELHYILTYFSATLTPDERYPLPQGTVILEPGASPDAPKNALTPIMLFDNHDGLRLRLYVARRIPWWWSMEFVIESRGAS